jgi:hypothetical protein
MVIVKLPGVVQSALDQFGDVFSNRCQRDHFGHYLTGLFIGRRKTIAGMSLPLHPIYLV